MDEKVLVVPSAKIEAHLRVDFTEQAARDVIAAANASRLFLPRSIVEEDESHKQIIPYVCIRHRHSYLLLTRTSKQSEKRLHNKMSLGIGGHINEAELTGAGPDLVHAGMMRELNEEISVGQPWSLQTLGVIYDGATPVGRVHLGVAYLLDTPQSDFTVNEPELMSATWVRASDLGAHRDRMEGWSQILFDHYIAKGG